MSRLTGLLLLIAGVRLYNKGVRYNRRHRR